MGNHVKIEIKTQSNLMIGGTPAPFEIGGIDQCTVVDGEGFPYIPASSLKGALRGIVTKDTSETAAKIAKLYEELLRKEKDEKWEQICEVLSGDEAAIKRVEERYRQAMESAAANYLFGIREFNNTPKILFNDLRLKEEYRNEKQCFSIDAKTSVFSNNEEVKSNPRTYKAARIGLVFEGELEFYHFEGDFCEADICMCKNYLIRQLEKFNEGSYRLGNSKSRGYGKICVMVREESGEK